MLQFGQKGDLWSTGDRATKGCLPQPGQCPNASEGASRAEEACSVTGGVQGRGLKEAEPIAEPQDPAHAEAELRTPAVRRVPPPRLGRGAHCHPLRGSGRGALTLPGVVSGSLPSPIGASASRAKGPPARPARRWEGETEAPSAPLHPHRAPLEARARRRCPGKSCCAPSARAPRPLPLRLQENTYSRATQGGSGSGRCASPRRLQSSRSPRQRQGAGHRRSAATARPLPSADPAGPSAAHSSSPSAAAGARSLGAPIAVPRPPARPCAPQPARARSPARTSSRGGCPQSARVRARALLPRSAANSFLLLPAVKPFQAPERREENEKGRLTAARLRYEQRRRAEAPFARKRNFFPASPPRSARPGPARRRRGLQPPARAHWPAWPRLPGHVTTTGLRARGGRTRERGAEIVGKSGLHFPASRARAFTTCREAYITGSGEVRPGGKVA